MRSLRYVVLSTLVQGLLVAPAQAQLPASSMEIAARSLPRPQIMAGELPRPCRSVRDKSTPPIRLRFASPEVEARMRADQSLHATFNMWIRQHFPQQDGCWTDFEFAAPKFQAAIGTDVTGALSMADVDRLAAALGTAREGIAEVRDGRADMKAGRPKTVVDFLPRPSGNIDHECAAVANRLRLRNQQETARRVSQLPPHMMRSAVTGNIEREVERESLSVAPEWADFWQRNPVLAAWEKANDCDLATLRAKVETWQLAMGVAPNARDPQAVERSVQLIAKARQDQAQFQTSQDTLLQAEAERRGETIRARVWALDELGSNTRMADLSSKVPTALCTSTASSIHCNKPSVPCTSEIQAVAAARGQQNYNHLVRPLDPFAVTPGAGPAATARQRAEDALQICQRKFAYTAAGNSRLMFGGQELQGAELAFNARGILSTLQLRSGPGAEAIRTALTERYGLPESQPVTRTRYETRAVGGGIGRTASGQEVELAPSIEQVPVNYTVTRYIWKTPTALVEETTGEVQFRFRGR